MVLETQVLPPPETSLRTTQPNVGNENVFYAHCPNCSKGYQIVDEKLQTLDPPSLCIRCGCPIEKHGDQTLAKVWMDEEAVKAHKPEIALVGEKMRGALDSVDAKWDDADALRERLAELEAADQMVSAPPKPKKTKRIRLKGLRRPPVDKMVRRGEIVTR